jgi:arylsulfatase
VIPKRIPLDLGIIAVTDRALAAAVQDGRLRQGLDGRSLYDDMGFGVPGSFGGPVPMPTLDRLSQNGLRYNFHTTAWCSPTRAALKSGRNHHSVNMGFITEMATAMPGSTGQITSATAPLAEMLRLNGSATAAFGKWHETATWETSIAGPSDRWPLRQGFDKFYGFFGGETNQWAPLLYDGTALVELPDDPNFHVARSSDT